jgi:WD40 repeat protein
MKILFLIASLLLLFGSETHAQEADLLGEIMVNSRTETAYDLEWHPDGDMVAAIGGFVLTLYDLHLEAVAPEWEIGEFVDVSWKPDGTQLAGAGGFRSPEISIWDYDPQEYSFERATNLDGGVDQYIVSWSPDGTQLASMIDRTSNIRIWNMEDSETLASYEFPYSQPARSLVWSADGTQISGVGVHNRRVTLFTADVETGEIAAERGIPQRALAFDLSPDGSLLSTIDEDGTTRIIDLASNETLLTFESVAEPVAIKWSPNGEMLAILSYRTTLQLWDIAQMLEAT